MKGNASTISHSQIKLAKEYRLQIILNSLFTRTTFALHNWKYATQSTRNYTNITSPSKSA